MAEPINYTNRIIGMILSYPTAELIVHLDEMQSILISEDNIEDKQLIELNLLFSYLKATDLLQLQEEYVALFDRTRLVSLHLFEHIWGESRRRGQAMADLEGMYQENGFTSSRNELPDYLPLFLEFLSTVSTEESDKLLGEVVDIFAILKKRLNEKESLYACLFSVLMTLTQKQPNPDVVQKALAFSKNVDNKKSLDEEWEDKPVMFGGPDPASNCASCKLHQPVKTEQGE